ncbi:MAG: flavodoxin domain-containing protein [Bradymonadales bacterium]|nr:flavodoxin domain-containing protein [Bradymonadales bacterium]
MSEVFNAIQVADRVFWVGAIDWELRDFHGYLTSRGTTYNAYLVLTDQVVLIDTVKASFKDQMMERIASVIDPARIQTIVSNHSELDHTGSLPATIERIRPERVVASGPGAKALKEHFHWNQPVQVVKDGEKLDLGNGSLQFFEARMLHWPDSQLAYLEPDGILFSNDVFGMHLASTERFAEQLDCALVIQEAARYYANIILPYSKKVTRLIEKLPTLSLDIRQIMPDHGPIWRQDPGQIVELYRTWAAQQRTRKAVVVYDTMWQSTAKMSRAVVEGLVGGGIDQVRVMPLEGSHRSDVATEVLDAGALLVGSPTLNNEIYPTVADVMTYLKGLSPANLLGASFGSYGWSPQSVKQLDRMLTEMGVQLVSEGVAVQYVPDAAALERCRALGAATAAQLIERHPEPSPAE